MNMTKIEDIEYAKAFMLQINASTGTHYQFVKDLDIERHGGSTPPQPEALFWDSEAEQHAVVEIKSFVYTLDDEIEEFQYKAKRISKWIQNYFEEYHLHDVSNTRYIVTVDIHEIRFNPRLVELDLEEADLFSGYFGKYLSLKIHKLHPGESKSLSLLLFKEFDRNESSDQVSYNDFYDNFYYLIIKFPENLKDSNTDQIIMQAKDYPQFAERLAKQWSEKKWSKKFKCYSSHKRYLFIDVDIRSLLGFAFVTGDFVLSDFVECFRGKLQVEYDFLLDAVDEIYFYTEGELQRLYKE